MWDTCPTQSAHQRVPTRLAAVSSVRDHPGRTRLQRLLEGGGAIAGAIVVMNVATYGFQMIAARMLGPAEYGAVAGLMALYLVASVLQIGLQTTAARRISASPDAVDEIERTILTLASRLSLALGGLLLVLAPLVQHTLRLESIYPALLLAVAAVPLTVQGAQAGILQGERRWLWLALHYTAAGVPRLLIGVVAMWVRPTEGAAMAAVALATFAPVVVGRIALRRRDHRGRPGEEGGHRLRAAFAESMHGSLAMLAFLAITNADILIARNVLSEHDSGLYAGGLILTKAVLFLPQFVVVVAFPALATGRERRRTLLRGLAGVCVLGAGCVLGSVALSGIAMQFVGGRDYAEIEERLWLFAALGTVLACLQLLVYAVLARQSRRSSYLMLAAVATLLAVSPGIDSLDRLLLTVAAVDAALLLALLALSLWRMRHDLVGR